MFAVMVLLWSLSLLRLLLLTMVENAVTKVTVVVVVDTVVIADGGLSYISLISSSGREHLNRVTI